MTDVSPEPGAQTAVPSPVARSREFTATDDKLWATVAHFGGVIGFPPSLLVFALARTRGTLTRQESKEALNWQITFTIGFIVLQILVSILQGIFIASGAYALVGIFSFLPLLLWILNAVFSILGGVKVQGGGAYRYPFAIRLVK